MRFASGKVLNSHCECTTSGPPGRQRAHGGGCIRRAQPRAGVDRPGVDRADRPDAVRLPAAQPPGQRQHAHIVPVGQKLPPQRQHRSHHAVDGGGIPVGRQQNFHRVHLPLRFRFLPIKTRQPGRFWQRKENFCFYGDAAPIFFANRQQKAPRRSAGHSLPEKAAYCRCEGTGPGPFHRCRRFSSSARRARPLKMTRPRNVMTLTIRQITQVSGVRARMTVRAM